MQRAIAMDRRGVRRSLVGAALGGGLFGAVSVYRSWVAPGALLDYVGPVGLMVVIGATVGGLVGPLVGEIADRRSAKARRESGPEERSGSERQSESESEQRTGSEREQRTGSEGEQRTGSEGDGERDERTAAAATARPPVWVTLLAGAAVGLGAGLAWERPVWGVLLGLVLALAARRIFR